MSQQQLAQQATKFTDRLGSIEIKVASYFVLSRFWAVASVWVLFLLEKNYTLSQIGLLDTGYFLAIFFFEIPTGVIADRFGRKLSILVSLLFKSLGIAWFALAATGWQIFLAFAVWGIGMTMTSGAEEAWLYDEIKINTDEDESNGDYQRIYGLLVGIGLISTAAANAMGGFLFEINPVLPILLTSVVFLLAAGILYTIPERAETGVTDSVENTKFALSALKKPVLLNLAAVSIIIGAIISVIIYWMQPFLLDQQLSPGFIGTILGAGIVMASFGSSWNKKLSEITGDYTLALMVGVFTLCFYLMPMIGIFGIFILFLMIRFIRGAFNPYMSTLLNDEFDKQYRSTALSIVSGMTTLSIAVTIWLTGRVIDNNSFELYFTINTLVLAGILLPLSLAYAYHRTKEE